MKDYQLPNKLRNFRRRIKAEKKQPARKITCVACKRSNILTACNISSTRGSFNFQGRSFARACTKSTL